MIMPKANEGYEVNAIVVQDAKEKTVSVKKNADRTFSFQMPSSQMVVTAAFKIAETGTKWVNPFTDVTRQNWFFESVRFACEKSCLPIPPRIPFAPLFA